MESHDCVAVDARRKGPTNSGSAIAFVDAPEGYEVELIQRGED